MKALITGANGMLGTELCRLLNNHAYKILATDIIISNCIEPIKYLDVRNRKEITKLICNFQPGIIFHLAAETDVDKCELNEKHAYKTNAEGTEYIAAICKELNIPLVYISTGAVFDGEKLGGYTEEDTTNPINIYGKSKLRGEETIQSMLAKYYIVRAGWMIGGYEKDKKFVWKIIQLLKTKKEISVITDKIGSPTFTKDFSKGILNIVSTGKYGIYHCVNKGICTRFDIAKKIVEYLQKKEIIVKPVTSEAFPLTAPRPKSEALINLRLSSMGLDNMRSWEEALREYVEKLINNKEK